MRLSKSQKNILEIAISETLISKGKNKGQTKGVLNQDCFDGRTTSSLMRKGLLDFRINTIYGTGWVATEKALYLPKTISQ